MNSGIATMESRLPHVQARRLARIAGAVYTLVFITGGYALTGRPGAMAANIAAAVCYIVVTLLFYKLFKPAGPVLSLVAAAISLTGCVIGAMSSVMAVNPLVFFGVYCILIAVLIWRSTFLPRVLAVGMLAGGIGWLTFASPVLTQALAPYNFVPGMIGEGALTLWLLIRGVNEEKWNEQASGRSSTND